MPIPSPAKGQKKEDFVSSFMSNETMKKEYPDKKQRLAIAYSQWKKQDKKERFSIVYGYEVKEMEGNLVVQGYIATSHLDSGFYDYSRDKFVRDKISKEALDTWANEINSGNPRTNKVSINHNREPHVTGVGIKGTARVDKLPNGEYGLFVHTLVDKTKEDFGDVQYRIDNNLIDSFSIEFTTRDPISGDYLEGAVVEETVGEGIIRTLLPGTQLEGWTLASQPMNEHAVMLKEIVKRNHADKKNKEESKMTEKKEDVPADKEEEPKEEAKETKKEEVIETKEETKEISSEEKELLRLGKEKKEQLLKEAKEKELLEIKEKVKSELKEDLNKIQVEEKVKHTKEGVVENKELEDFSKALMEGKTDKVALFKMAGKIADMAGFTARGFVKPTTTEPLAREFKHFSTNGTMIEVKGLGITTNQTTDTDYLLSAAELSDVFDPVVYNVLNQATVTWNILQKEDYSNKGNNLVQFTLKTAANTTASSYTGDSITTGNVTREKFKTQFKKYQVGVQVSGDMIAAARGGPIGDVFAREVMDSTEDLLAVMNADLFAEVGLESAAGVIGFEYITDQAGNTTLYDKTRSQSNGLSSTATTDNYINGSSADISFDNLRSAKRKALKEGANIQNLVFVTDHIQGDKIRSKLMAQQRYVPTSSRAGFEGMIEFDGIPVFEDKDCNDDDVFLVDLETHRIAIWVPPTLEMLGKDSDSQKCFIKTYWCTFNRAPRRMVQIYSNATS